MMCVCYLQTVLMYIMHMAQKFEAVRFYAPGPLPSIHMLTPCELSASGLKRGFSEPLKDVHVVCDCTPIVRVDVVTCSGLAVHLAHAPLQHHPSQNTKMSSPTAKPWSMNPCWLEAEIPCSP